MTFVSWWLNSPRGPTTALRTILWNVGTRDVKPSRNADLAAIRLIAATCSRNDAAVNGRLKRAWMDPRVGKNWGLNPPLNPSCKLPGIIRCTVSVLQLASNTTPYTIAKATSGALERALRCVISAPGATSIMAIKNRQQNADAAIAYGSKGSIAACNAGKAACAAGTTAAVALAAAAAEAVLRRC